MGMKCRSLIKELGSITNYGDIDVPLDIINKIKDKFNILQEYILTEDNILTFESIISIVLSCVPNKQSINQILNGNEIFGKSLDYKSLPGSNSYLSVLYVPYVVGSTWKGIVS